MAGLLSGLFGAQPQAQAPGQSINGQSLLQKLLDPSFAMPIASALMQRGQGNAANFGDAFGAAGQAMARKHRRTRRSSICARKRLTSLPMWMPACR